MLWIQARVKLYESRRNELGMPMPTSDFPLPKDEKCKFCLRSWRCRNPLLLGVFSKSPFLTAARVGSAECYSCRMGQLWSFKGRSKVELLEDLKVPDFFVKYCFVIFVWEEKVNDPDAPLLRLVGPALVGDLGLDLIKKDYVALEGTVEMGIFWPSAVWKKHHNNEEPPKNLLDTYVHNGNKIRGVFREPSEGCPIGSIRVTQRAGQKVEMKRKLESSTEAVRGEEQVKETFKKLQAVGDVKMSISREGKISALTGLKKSNDDPFDDIWANVFEKQKNVPPAPREPQAGRKSSAAASGDGEPPAKKTAMHDKSEKEALKRLQEFDLSEQAILKSKQMLRNMQDAETVSSVTDAKISVVAKLLQARLKDSLMEMYALDYSAGRSSGDDSKKT
jgi:hypothetical protein